MKESGWINGLTNGDRLGVLSAAWCDEAPSLSLRLPDAGDAPKPERDARTGRNAGEGASAVVGGEFTPRAPAGVEAEDATTGGRPTGAPDKDVTNGPWPCIAWALRPANEDGSADETRAEEVDEAGEDTEPVGSAPAGRLGGCHSAGNAGIEPVIPTLRTDGETEFRFAPTEEAPRSEEAGLM